jgi:N-methylhydantoinase A
VDIGGTFTDIALELPGPDREIVTAKTSTTPQNPVDGVLTGIDLALQAARIAPSDIRSVIHGTTLATNALIERKGARVAVILTEGFRDILEIAYERRYDQYDIFLDKPDMIVQREHCFTLPGRMSARGEILQPLDEAALDAVLNRLAETGIESVGVCLLHSYANAAHEQRIRERIEQCHPHLSVSLSSEVSPEVREFDRLCTAVANAFIRPLMERYLRHLARALREKGIGCPLLLMTSGGGMTTLETAARFPVRLVESGPSGGAMLASRVALQCGIEEMVSFDMGGTTAKVCLIDDARPQTSRRFEVGRAARFIRGSGLPIRIPVIEMIEIGAGGGSIAAVDGLGRLAVGPESAGADPGPACYARGGSHATVTDSDVAMGFIDPETFADGRMQLDCQAARLAIERDVAAPMTIDPMEAAAGIGRIVDENMANAARVHAVESGKDFQRRKMVAFGGNGPLHAARVAERIGVHQVIVPRNPSVGSAVGFLYAPVSYEIVQSLYTRLDSFDLDGVNRLLAAMRVEAMRVVAEGAGDRKLADHRVAFMRYKGQGHEIEVDLPPRPLVARDIDALREAYEARYRSLFQRSVPGMIIEVMNWGLTVSTAPDPVPRLDEPAKRREAPRNGSQPLFIDSRIGLAEVPTYRRQQLEPGDWVSGPALIIEGQTTTFVGPRFDAVLDGGGNIVMTKRAEDAQ